MALCITVTLVTAPPDYSRIKGLAFGTMNAQEWQQERGSLTRMDIVFSVILIGLVIGILAFFTG